jgi:hypothetical protein
MEQNQVQQEVHQQPVHQEATHVSTVKSVNAMPQFNKSVISQKVQQLLIFIYSAVSIILTGRFILSLLGVSQQTPFVSFVYQLTYPFMTPFANMFGRQLQAGQYRVEFEVLVALLVYALVFIGIAKLIGIIFD